MKKLLLLTTLFTITFNESKAQYNPMLGDTTEWCLAWNFMPLTRLLENHFFNAHTDTIYDSLTYKKVFADGGYYGAMREDTLSQQLLFIKAGDTTEYLIYDFSLNLSDTLTVDLYNNFSSNLNDGFYIVDSVSYVNIRGGLRKYIRLHNPMNTNLGSDGKPLKLEWIESLGNIHHPFYTYAYDYFGFGPLTFSCNNNHESAVMKQTINAAKNYVDICAAVNVAGSITADTCQIGYFGSINENSNQVQLSVFPNPSNGSSITIDVNNYTIKNNCTVIISDATGRSVYSKSISKTGNSVTINDFTASNGIYFITLMNEKNVFGNAKLVIENSKK